MVFYFLMGLHIFRRGKMVCLCNLYICISIPPSQFFFFGCTISRCTKSSSLGNLHWHLIGSISITFALFFAIFISLIMSSQIAYFMHIISYEMLKNYLFFQCYEGDIWRRSNDRMCMHTKWKLPLSTLDWISSNDKFTSSLKSKANFHSLLFCFVLFKKKLFIVYSFKCRYQRLVSQP